MFTAELHGPGIAAMLFASIYTFGTAGFYAMKHFKTHPKLLAYCVALGLVFLMAFFLVSLRIGAFW